LMICPGRSAWPSISNKSKPRHDKNKDMGLP
jgi:hypothetical protein